MLAGLRRDFRLAPLTFSLLAGAVLLFLAVEISRGRGADPMTSGRRAFGAVETLALTADHDVYGPFDLWSGPWWRGWRILASAFHHANFLHIVGNISLLWYLGPLLERRMSWWRYLLFWILAAVIPFLPEYWLGYSPIGLSGVACAMFGWSLIERHFDTAVAIRAHDGFVKTTWFFLVGCIVLTLLNVLPVANVAHFVGVGYGWLVARAGRWRSWRWPVRLSHAVVVPLGIWLVLHPFWNARYHARCGLLAKVDRADHATAEKHFREAIRLNPGLALPWHGLAMEQLQQHKLLEAWRVSVDGLKANRTSKSLAELVQHIWRTLPNLDRAAGRKHLEIAFADEAVVWSQRLQLTDQPVAESEFVNQLRDLFPGTRPEATDAQPPKSRRRKQPLNPDRDDSAAEGQLL